MKTKALVKIFSLGALSLLFLLMGSTAQAQNQGVVTDYAVLVNLPGTTVPCTVRDSNGRPVNAACTDLSRYLPTAFNLAIGIAVGLAFVMIVYGGVMYATSDALSGKAAGREALENALWGLLLVISSYLILQTINPRMLDFTLNIQQFASNPAAGGGTGGVIVPTSGYTYTTLSNGTRILNGYTLTPAQQQQNSVLLNQLQTNTQVAPNPSDSVEVNAGPCTTGRTSGCTNIVGLPASVITRLKAMKAACGSVVKDCYVQVTGGAEGGHATHGPNLPMVDVSDSPSLRTYFAKTEPQAKTPHGAKGLRGTPGYIPATQVNIPGGGVATYEETGDNGRASGNHWHIQF
jgi:hypothetical protein